MNRPPDGRRTGVVVPMLRWVFQPVWVASMISPGNSAYFVPDSVVTHVLISPNSANTPVLESVSTADGRF